MAVQEVTVKENIRRIVSQLQIITLAAESGHSDIVLASIGAIEALLAQIKRTV